MLIKIINKYYFNERTFSFLKVYIKQLTNIQIFWKLPN